METISREKAEKIKSNAIEGLIAQQPETKEIVKWDSEKNCPIRTKIPVYED